VLRSTPEEVLCVEFRGRGTVSFLGATESVSGAAYVSEALHVGPLGFGVAPIVCFLPPRGGEGCLLPGASASGSE
jgi:hypothetical protein